MMSDASSLLGLVGAEDAAPTAFLHVSGDSPNHMASSQNSLIRIGQPILMTVGNRSMGTWAAASANGVVSGHYQSQALGGTVTGAKYLASLNGVVNSEGNGVNYFQEPLPERFRSVNSS